jgi:hypothetical protein
MSAGTRTQSLRQVIEGPMDSLTLENVASQREACGAFRKVQRLLERRALLAFLVLATAVVLNGCAGVVTAGPKSSAAPQTSIQLTPSSINFGSTIVGKKVSQTVTVANTGKSTVKIKKAKLSSGQFSLSGPAMPLSLAAGESSSFQVWFDASTAGNAVGTLSVQTDNGISSEQVVLAGTATAASPQISVSSGSLNLGSTTVGATSDGTLTLTNTGATNLVISLLSVGGGPFGISGITTPSTIAPGGSTSFSVLFSPTIVGGDSGSITITSNDPQTPTTIIALTGTATASPVAPSITTQPTNQTVTAGQMATFAVVAGGTAPLSYQWQKNGANIAGATSTSYTTPATANSDSGD